MRAAWAKLMTRSWALARAQAAGEQPVVPANGNRPNFIFDLIVIHG